MSRAAKRPRPPALSSFGRLRSACSRPPALCVRGPRNRGARYRRRLCRQQRSLRLSPSPLSLRFAGSYVPLLRSVPSQHVALAALDGCAAGSARFGCRRRRSRFARSYVPLLRSVPSQRVALAALDGCAVGSARFGCRRRVKRPSPPPASLALPPFAAFRIQFWAPATAVAHLACACVARHLTLRHCGSFVCAAGVCGALASVGTRAKGIPGYFQSVWVVRAGSSGTPCWMRLLDVCAPGSPELIRRRVRFARVWLPCLLAIVQRHSCVAE